MNKYVIDLRPDCKVVQQICEKDSQIYTSSTGVHYLEELTVDYIQKNCKSLLDAFYQKGFDEGKAVHEKGCDGCQFEGTEIYLRPCGTCRNAYPNQWTAKDNKIKVGDEVRKIIIHVDTDGLI